MRGREEVAVVAADEFERLKDEPTEQAIIEALRRLPRKPIEIDTSRDQRTGQAPIDALRNSPHPEVDLEPPRYPMPVRDVLPRSRSRRSSSAK